MITGAGIDLFDIARMEREVARQGTHLLEALFSGAELASCTASRSPCRDYAARFAVKEACFKALGTGMVGRMTWCDITTTMSGHGRVAVGLTGETAQVAAGQGLRHIHVALSMTRDRAVAWAVAVGVQAEEGADAV